MTAVRQWLVLVFACAVSVSLRAQQALIPIGFTSILSGPQAACGQGLLQGVQVAVARANAAGGIGGCLFELVALDDAGDPRRTAANVRQLLDRGVVRRVVNNVCAEQPEALILVVDAAAAFVAIQEGKARRCASQYLVFSETGAALAACDPGSKGPHPLAGLLVTQVVPHPNRPLHPLVGEYQRALTAYAHTASSYPSLEGYLAMRVLQEALSGCVREAQRACLLRWCSGSDALICLA